MRSLLVRCTQVAAVTLIFFVVGWLLCYVARAKNFSISDTAAWAQAVFSVIAIAAAIWISTAERRFEHRREKKREADSILAVVILIYRGADIIKAFSSERIGKPSAASIRSLEVLIERLEGLDLVTGPSPVILRGSLESAYLIRRYIHSASKPENGDPHKIQTSLERQAGRILEFYNLTEDDLPKPASRPELQ